MKQTERGVELTIIPKNDIHAGSADSLSYNTKLVPDKELSPDCGADYFRCKPLQVTNQGDNSLRLLLVPLNGGLLLVELKFSNKSLTLEFGSHRIVENEFDQCSPTTIFKVDDSYYTVCTDLQNKKITLYEIRVNVSAIEQAVLLGPLHMNGLLDAFTSSDLMNVSNFLLSTDIPHQPLIFYAIDNYVFGIDIFDYTSLYGTDVPSIGSNCDYIHRLVPASNNLLLAYCSSESVYFDVEAVSWQNELSYADSGVPYLCPNNTYAVNAFKNYLQYSIGPKSGTLSGVNVDSGVCINGTKGLNLFAYTDKVADKTVLLDLTSSGHSEKSLCENHGCLPLITFGDPIRYLLIREPANNGRLTVLDAERNFSVIISADHEMSDMFALVRVKAPINPQPLPPRKAVANHIIGVISGGALVLAILTVLSIAIVLFYMFNKKKNGYIPLHYTLVIRLLLGRHNIKF